MRLRALPGNFYRLAVSGSLEVPRVARERVALVLLIERAHAKGLTVRAACQVVGVPRATYYRWRARLAQAGPAGLADGRAGNRRQRIAPVRSRLRPWIEDLRRRFAMGKEKLRVLLARVGVMVSASSVGRVIRELIQRGVIHPVGYARRASRGRRAAAERAHARRKRAGVTPSRPGELVQVDTLQERSLTGVRYHFSAVDPITRTAHAGLYTSASSRNATAFLLDLRQALPFELTNVQVDNGSEFMGAFESACQHLGIALYTIPPRTPKANANVERIQRTFRDEHYAFEPPTLTLTEQRQHLAAYLHHYNHERPHQALAYRTPNEYADTWNLHPESQLT
jgi:putative transposase